MDIELSSEDLAFRDEVRAFFDENKIKEGEDYFSWRLGWFKKAREKGGWDVPKWPVVQPNAKCAIDHNRSN